MNKFFGVLLFLLFASCQQESNHPYTFYYWRTDFSLNETERKILDHAKVPFLYTRFFDVDKINGGFQPMALISKKEDFKLNKDIVPVVYITNRSFVDIKKDEIPFLAKQIFELIQKKQKELGFNESHEIQIDCDWTSSTRNDYFEFLKSLKKLSKKSITCTLRLHQVKDQATTGIPPVDKVYLMCYSTSSPLENSSRNSILEVQLLKNYLAKIDQYPIEKIDIALPIYSWGIVINHLGKRKIINAISKKDLEQPEFKKISDDQVEVLKDGFYFGTYLNKGFQIKVEEISEQQLREVTKYLDQKIRSYHIVYYQLDSRFIDRPPFSS